MPPGYKVPSNYDWLPFPVTSLVHKVKPGHTIELVDSLAAERFRPYFDKVKEWTLEISVDEQVLEDAGFLLAPIATNKSGKMISAGVFNPAFLPGGGVSLLPKPTTCDTHEAIELLIDIATGKSKVELEWRERIEIPGMSSIDAEIRKHEGSISLLQKDIDDLRAKRVELDKYRDLFSVHEEPQVEAVRKVLMEIGIETERTSPGFVVDLVGKEAAVEVTSATDKIGTKSDSLTQISRFIQTERKTEKVILVANTYKRLSLEERVGKVDFSGEVKDFLDSLKVCYMTSSSLYFLWRKAREGRVSLDEANRLILETNGELYPSSTE